MTMKVVTASQMKDIERGCAQRGLPSEVLMENAGLAFAQEIKLMLGNIARLLAQGLTSFDVATLGDTCMGQQERWLRTSWAMPVSAQSHQRAQTAKST